MQALAMSSSISHHFRQKQIHNSDFCGRLYWHQNQYNSPFCTLCLEAVYAK